MAALWIRITAETASAATLGLEGQISARWVSVLEEESSRLLGEGKDLVLDLSGVTYISLEGARVLSELSSKGVRLANGSPLIEGLLSP